MVGPRTHLACMRTSGSLMQICIWRIAMTHRFLQTVYGVVNIFLVSGRIGISSVICKGILPGFGVLILERRRRLGLVDSPNDRGSDLQQDDEDKHDGELNR